MSISKFIIFLVYHFFSMNVQALSCPAHINARDFAKILIKAELSGIRYETDKTNTCLEQNKFPNLLIVKDR